MPEVPFRADPRLLDAARRLGPLADFLVIPSNATHIFRPDIERASGREVLSIIDVTLAEVRRRGWRKVGCWDTATRWSTPARSANSGSPARRWTRRPERRLDESIMGLIEGRTDAALYVPAREAVATLRARGVDGIIPGCTEIPLLLGESANDADLVNPAQLLAEAAVQRAYLMHSVATLPARQLRSLTLPARQAVVYFFKYPCFVIHSTHRCGQALTGWPVLRMP